MDNIQEPVQADPQGQSATEQQVPEVQQEGATSENESGEATTFEELAAKKGWKTPDDLAKAYANLEGHSTKVSQDKAKLEREFFSLNPTKEEVQDKRQELQAKGDDVALAELDKFVSQRIKEETSKIRAEFQDKDSRRDLRETIEKHPDFGKYAPDVKEIKKQYPNMPFSDALLMAKAQKGDLTTEARRQGMTQGAQVVARQQGAQVAPTKTAKEGKITASELLEGAGQRWKAPNTGVHSPQAVAEIEAIERELFGQVLQKTPSGL